MPSSVGGCALLICEVIESVARGGREEGIVEGRVEERREMEEVRRVEGEEVVAGGYEGSVVAE